MKKPRKPKKTVTFKIEDELFELLETKAKEYECSPHICGRILVTEALLGQSYLMEALREMKESQQRQERNLKIATVAILVDAGKASPEEGQAFVRERMS